MIYSNPLLHSLTIFQDIEAISQDGTSGETILVQIVISAINI